MRRGHEDQPETRPAEPFEACKPARAGLHITAGEDWRVLLATCSLLTGTMTKGHSSRAILQETGD